ncbi:MAG: SDR family NAD(P)-dependent oxidoreductase [Candidatus Omnitrophota bacterium]|nr:MAG: SDR family NAD(P)-dependent oxidoreductase [Candidatus Omnitrophota bacterium]
MKKVLVTGGAGFIGSHLVDRLVTDGKDVVVLDNFDPQVHQGKKPDYMNKDACYIEGDIRDDRALKKSLNGVDSVFHLAAKVGVGQSMYKIKDYVDANTLGTASFWEYIINNKLDIKKFIVASSMSIYGEGIYDCAKCGIMSPYLRSEGQLKKRQWEFLCPGCGSKLNPLATGEDKKLLATSVYAITKKDQEELSINIGTSYKIPTVALRFFNAYGPRQSLSNPYTGACAIFSARIKNDKAPLLYEDGLQTRDFIDVRDVVEACTVAMNNRKADYGVFNVGMGIARTIRHVAEILTELYGKNIEPEIANRYRAGDIRHCYADIKKIKDIGFEPKIDFKEGLKNLVEWGKVEKCVDKTDDAILELEERKLTL